MVLTGVPQDLIGLCQWVHSRGSASLQFTDGLKYLSKVNQCRTVTRVPRIFHWGSAPPEKLKTPALYGDFHDNKTPTLFCFGT